jgi:aspartyl protease family protein
MKVKIAAALTMALALLPAAGAAAAVTEIAADTRGHFVTKAEIDGTDITVVVDTGASFVALSYEDAEAVGLRPQSLSYDAPVLTANGAIKAARVNLRQVEIDGVRVRDVQGMVLPAGAIGVSLLGMSFLSHLRSFRIEDGVLRLED